MYFGFLISHHALYTEIRLVQFLWVSPRDILTVISVFANLSVPILFTLRYKWNNFLSNRLCVYSLILFPVQQSVEACTDCDLIDKQCSVLNYLSECARNISNWNILNQIKSDQAWGAELRTVSNNWIEVRCNHIMDEMEWDGMREEQCNTLLNT